MTTTVASARFESARALAGALHGHGFSASASACLPPAWAAFAGDEVGALRHLVQACTRPLDRRALHTLIDEPTDERIARWIQQQLRLPVPADVAVHSTPNQGVALSAQGHAQLWRRYRFESAHRLPHVPAGHKCGRMHGHGFQAIVRAAATHASLAQLDACWAPIGAQLHHRCLNDIAGLANPTSERLSAWLWERLQPQVAGLASVAVFETGSCGAVYDGRRHGIWKDFTLDSAVQLSSAPPGDPRAWLHGHTYTLRLQLCATLDEVLGWTVDFGDVKSLFDPVFRALDHQPLHEGLGLPCADTGSLAGWVLAQGRQRLPQLAGVELYETDGCGAIVSDPSGLFNLPCFASA